jgi:hypothetical protein
MYPRRRRDSNDEMVDDMPPSLESPIKMVGRKRGR